MTARVLVVDDIPANVKLLEARLSAEYFDVVTAMNGADALTICERAECDVVLLDVMMPDMDGFEVCRRLKSNPAHASHPGGHGHGARPAVRPGEGARGRRRRFPHQAGVRRRADRARALAGAAQDDDRRAAHARGHLARHRHREPGARRGRRHRPAGQDPDRRRPAGVGRAHPWRCCRRRIRSISRPIRTRRCSTPPKATTTCSSSRSASRISTGCACAARCARWSARATSRSWRSPTPRTTRAWCAGSRSASTTT